MELSKLIIELIPKLLHYGFLYMMHNGNEKGDFNLLKSSISRPAIVFPILYILQRKYMSNTSNLPYY